MPREPFTDSLVAAGVVSERVSLGPLTTYKFGGPARWYAEARSDGELSAIMAARRAAGIDLLILGRGSNLLVADAGYGGVVVRLAGDFSVVSFGEDGIITAGGAVSNTYGYVGYYSTGDGTVTLSGSNSYEGDTTVSAGTLKLDTGASLDSGTTVRIPRKVPVALIVICWSQTLRLRRSGSEPLTPALLTRMSSRP